MHADVDSIDLKQATVRGTRLLINAAAYEIAKRVGSDPLFPISTIHSFCWRISAPTIRTFRLGY